METMHFHIAYTKILLRTTLSRSKEVPMSNLSTMRNSPGGGGVNCLPGYK